MLGGKYLYQLFILVELCSCFLSFFFRDNSALRMVGIPGQNGKICVARAWKFLPLFLLLFFILSILVFSDGVGCWAAIRFQDLSLFVFCATRDLRYSWAGVLGL